MAVGGLQNTSYFVKQYFKEDHVSCEYRSFKRYYRSNQESLLKRQIIAVYPLNKQYKSIQSPFQHCSGNILTYCFSGEERNRNLCKNVLVYESTKNEIKKKLTQKRTVTCSLETNESRNIDPLRKLINKLKQDGERATIYLSDIIIENGTYNVSLIKELSVKNIANFCCTENKNYKSSLNFDFTFELLKDPPLFAFIACCKNTSLKVKGRNHSLTMLGPIVLCHDRKTETIKKSLEKVTEKFRDITQYVQMIGCDSKKPIINASCYNFPAAVIPLCANHDKRK